jgi:hypothetical protein
LLWCQGVYLVLSQFYGHVWLSKGADLGSKASDLDPISTPLCKPDIYIYLEPQGFPLFSGKAITDRRQVVEPSPDTTFQWGFILVSECLPGIIFASSKLVKYIERGGSNSILGH